MSYTEKGSGLLWKAPKAIDKRHDKMIYFYSFIFMSNIFILNMFGTQLKHGASLPLLRHRVDCTWATWRPGRSRVPYGRNTNRWMKCDAVGNAWLLASVWRLLWWSNSHHGSSVPCAIMFRDANSSFLVHSSHFFFFNSVFLVQKVASVVKCESKKTLRTVMFWS